MQLTFPKKQFTINIHTKHAEYLEAQAAKEERSVDNIVMSALLWYQMVHDLPGAREAVIACEPPSLSKKAPMPSMLDLTDALNNLGL